LGVELRLTRDVLIAQDREPALSSTSGRVTMLSVRAGAYFDFNGVASEIWNMVSEPCTFGGVCDALAERYQGDPATIALDVERFVEALVKHRLLHLIKARR
jgi:hypothetical protein